MKHKLGVIGFGGMASWHLSNSVKVPDVEFVAAYDIDPERLVEAEKKGLKPYKKLEDFLADKSFDMVLVATPNNFHKPMAIAAMKAGKNVICEKPVAMNAAELEDMIAVSKEMGVVFTVHQNRRWDRDFRIIKDIYDRGLIGKPYTIEHRVHGQNGVMEGWRAYKVAGGGMLFDWGVHLLDQMLFMIDEKVHTVYAQLRNIKTPEVDDYVKVILTFESGLSATVEIGTYCLAKLPKWYVNGDQGSAIIEDWDCNGKIVKGKQVDFKWVPEVVQTSAGPTRSMAPRPKETIEELPLPDQHPDWADLYKNVIAAIEGREELIVKPCQALRVMKVIDAAFKSNETGEAIFLDI